MTRTGETSALEKSLIAVSESALERAGVGVASSPSKIVSMSEGELSSIE